jgi:Zn-dependent protease
MSQAKRGGASPMSGFRLGSVLGFEIRIDLSWFVIFFLVFWSLAEAVFPAEYPDLPRLTHLGMGLAGTLLFFASLLAHELSHAVVSRFKGIPVEGITLFIFGGMAWTKREPDTPRDELMIAGVGPLTSLRDRRALRHRRAPIRHTGPRRSDRWSGRLPGVHQSRARDLQPVPGFPLDGGRVLRAIVWSLTGDRSKATRWAVLGGRSFGMVLIVLGAIQALTVSPVSGLWLVFIGWFLRNLAGSSLQQQISTTSCAATSRQTSCRRNRRWSPPGSHSRASSTVTSCVYATAATPSWRTDSWWA